MLQRLHLLFLPWSESTATPGKVLLSCTSLLQSPFALLLLMFGMTLKPDPKRPVEIQGWGGEAKERETGIEDRKRVCLRNKKQKFIRKVHQNSRRCSQYSYNLVASPLALPFLLSILPLSCFGFRPGQSGLIFQLKYVILGNLLKLCEPQIPNLKNENNTPHKVVKRNKCHDIETTLGT